MELLANLGMGFQAALSAQALLFCLIGVTLGIFVGVLPGIGALATISMCLPITFYLPPMIAMIMLAGIFYGAQYGGSIASILLNLPGDPPAAITCLDGYPMTKQGRAGVALFITTLGSFVGGCFSIVLLILFAPTLAAFAIGFSSADYFAIMLMALVAASTLSVGSPVKGLTMVALGLVVGLVGTDINSGQFRFTFGIAALSDGISIVAVAMGFFGIAEILTNAAQYGPGAERPRIDAKSVTLRSLMPTRDDLRLAWKPIVRGSLIGAGLGMLPGTGPTISTFMAYAAEKRLAKDPTRFGTGAIEGVAAPEAANNANVQAAFIPTLSLGIPGDAIMAVMLGGLLIHGITPGPQFIAQQPVLFWGVVASFWIGNLFLLILNLPLIGIWVRLLAIPYKVLFPAMLFFICVGVFSVNNSTFDVMTTIVFGLAGFVLNRHGYPAAPLLLGFVLGPLLEEHFRRAVSLANGDLSTFVTRPISLAFLIAAALILLSSLRMMRGLFSALPAASRGGTGPAASDRTRS